MVANVFLSLREQFLKIEMVEFRIYLKGRSNIFWMGWVVENKKMEETKDVTQGFLALLTSGRIDLILTEMKKLSFGHFNLKHYCIIK